MMQAGVVNAPIERSAAAKPTPGVTPVHDLNVPYEGTEEYETPTADLLFPPVSFFVFVFHVIFCICDENLCFGLYQWLILLVLWNVRPRHQLQSRKLLCNHKLQAKHQEPWRLIIFLLGLVMILLVAMQVQIQI